MHNLICFDLFTYPRNPHHSHNHVTPESFLETFLLVPSSNFTLSSSLPLPAPSQGLVLFLHLYKWHHTVYTIWGERSRDVWLLLVNVIILRFIHIVARINSVFLFYCWVALVTWIYHSLSIHMLIDILVVCSLDYSK